MPQPLDAARWLVYAIFGFTVLGGIGLLLSASDADAVDAELVGLTLWAAAPGTAGWLLVRRLRTGGIRRWRGLIAVQVWLLVGALATVAEGSFQGFTQLLLPVLILVFLSRPESREWVRLAPELRAEHRPFSFARFIRWRRDGGQTTVEYAGLFVVVAAIVVGLVVSGVGGQVSDGLRSAVCSITGAGCPAGGGGTVEAGDGADEPGDPDGPDGPGGPDAPGEPGEPSDPADPRTEGPGGTVPVAVETDEDRNEGADGEPGWEDDEAASGGEGGDGGGEQQEPEEDCGGWGFFSCAADRVTQVGKGLVVDGVWGDVKGVWDLVTDPGGTLDGLKDYGSGLAEQWSDDAAEAGDKWGRGDYLDALTDWGGASVNTVVGVGDDVFVGDEVRERWNNGEKTRAVTDVIWNIGSTFIPGYNAAKIGGKVGKVGKLGKLGKLGEAADKAAEAAERARKAAGKGDVKAADEAAAEAQKHADDAERELAAKGCFISSGPLGGRVPGPPGLPGTERPSLSGGVNAAGRTVAVYRAGGVPVLLPLEKKCEGASDEEVAAAEQAKKDAAAAKEAAREAGRQEVANWKKPSWYDSLKDPVTGSADGGTGTWKEKKSVAYGPHMERWMRYQEQVSGVQRGKEYAVNDPQTGRPVDFDGWDSGTKTFKEAKFGYSNKVRPDGTLEPAVAARWVEQAQRQLRAANGKPVEWNFSNQATADAAQKAFDDAEIDVGVVHTPWEK
ncbi:restriction endonuclease fold toxin 5 domain-containing protein [Streptomyces sp. NBC_01498]|uniref:Tox-REase-5 domain-containing protein n=1 Tax=Streptomyces sp. NBC_01498 TaxID=2975870 RepID=UPI002E7B9805|nr:Tox-REase-5 domain-containing protein [Streptomyces sp. NBC_01498]WTL25113.1 restriction endonuclease fold toxin 5 domain-containing protein [Streptomyces sp. NBC_01498]